MHTLPIPIIRPFRFPSKVATPPDIGLTDWNIDFLPVMCCKQPLSRYQAWCFFPAIKEVCNRNYFVLRYPNLFGSIFFVSMWVLVSIGWTLWWVALFRESLNLWVSWPTFPKKITNDDFFTMYDLFAFETMAKFVFGVSLHLNNFVKSFMTTNKLA